MHPLPHQLRTETPQSVLPYRPYKSKGMGVSDREHHAFSISIFEPSVVMEIFQRPLFCHPLARVINERGYRGHQVEFVDAGRFLGGLQRDADENVGRSHAGG